MQRAIELGITMVVLSRHSEEIVGSISARGCAMRGADGNTSLYMVIVSLLRWLMVNVNWVLI